MPGGNTGWELLRLLLRVLGPILVLSSLTVLISGVALAILGAGDPPGFACITYRSSCGCLS